MTKMPTPSWYWYQLSCNRMFRIQWPRFKKENNTYHSTGSHTMSGHFVTPFGTSWKSLSLEISTWQEEQGVRMKPEGFNYRIPNSTQTGQGMIREAGTGTGTHFYQNTIFHLPWESQKTCYYSSHAYTFSNHTRLTAINYSAAGQNATATFE